MAEPEVTDQEAEQFHAMLKQQADQWRQRLADPVIAAQVKAGKIQISPLVKELLLAFPPKSSTSTEN